MRFTSGRLLSMLVMISLGIVTRLGHAEVAKSPAEARALPVGDAAPSFTASRADGTVYRFESHQRARPIVIIFYRGGWCPYCNTQLADLHEVEPKLKRAGFDVIFLSTDRPALLYASLKEQNRRLPYTLLSDSGLGAAEAFHIAYHLDDAAYAKQLQYGIDLEKTTGTALHELPVPSVFIIDKAGTIRFVYSNPDYSVRLQADELWSAAQSLQSNH